MEVARGTKEFGTWLRERRTELDLTQEELANRVGCSPYAISKIELGQRRPSRQVAELIAEALGLPPDERSNVVRWARAGYGADRSQLINPYKGLQAFDEADAPYFFGREALTQRLLSRLGEPGPFYRFLAVVGPSGSGKSSVVRAGLIPALRSAGLPPGDPIEIVSMLPGTYPWQELQIACAWLSSSGGNPDASLLIFIDQFEELFTLTCDEVERSSFLADLYRIVAEPHSRTWVVVTLRADFYDRPLIYANASKLFAQRAEVVEPMSIQEMNRAITGPAEQAGLILEPGLVEIIERDVGEQPGSLPLLEYALTELFDRRVGRTLSIQAYEESGGALGALSNRAEAIHSELTASEQEEERQMFLRLVSLGEEGEETRRRAPRAELASAARDEEALDQVLEVFGRYRLLTFDHDPTTRRPTVEVAHEALIRTWPRLRTWLEANREGLRLERQLMAASAEWANSGKDPSFLASGARLARFEPLALSLMTPEDVADATPTGVALTEDEKEYIQASVKERERAQAARERTRRRVTTGLAIGLVLMLILAMLAVLQSIQANDQRNTAEIAQKDAFSRELAAKSVNVFGLNPNLSLLLAIEAVKTSQTDDAEQALRRAIVATQPHTNLDAADLGGVSGAIFSPDGSEVAAIGGTAAEIWQVNDRTDTSGNSIAKLDVPGSVGARSLAFNPDGKQLVVGSSDGIARVWDIAQQTPVAQLKGHTNVITSVAFSPDGKKVATGSNDATARIWDASTGKQLEVLGGYAARVTGVAFSPDGKLVAAGSADNTAKIWDAITGRAVVTLTGHTASVNSVGFSPDGKRIVTASSDKTVRIWDAGTGKTLLTFPGHTDIVHSAAFSPDGKLIVTGSDDKSAIVWDASTGQQVATMDVSLVTSPSGNEAKSQSPVVQVSFSPDGKRVLMVTGVPDNAAWIYPWDLFTPLSQLMPIALTLPPRQFTCEERQTYLHETNACGTPTP